MSQKFTVNTKPLIDGLNLGILNANITTSFQRSNMVQITANRGTLTVNIEAACIFSELEFKGMGTEDEPVTIFVNSSNFKQLVSTFESSTTIFEFDGNGLILHNGKSSFTLPKMIDVDDMSFERPTSLSDNTRDLNSEDWKFIKDYQMYAIAMSFVHPVYTKAWCGESGDVLVGDFDIGLFTHSKKCNLGSTCLLSDTIINLITSLPEGAKMCKIDNNYVVHVKTDSFTFTSEFVPKYESDDDMGNYYADMIMSVMNTSGESVKVNVAAIMKVLNQADLLSSNNDDSVKMTVSTGQVLFDNINVNCIVPAEGTISTPYSVEFNLDSLKRVMSKCSEDFIQIFGAYNEGEISGITISSNDLTISVAAEQD